MRSRVDADGIRATCAHSRSSLAQLEIASGEEVRARRLAAGRQTQAASPRRLRPLEAVGRLGFSHEHHRDWDSTRPTSRAIAEMLERYGDRFLRRVFTDGEIAYCTRRRNPVPHLAGRFAAKEAAMKALGTGHSRGVLWKDIEVVRRGGPPQLRLHGGAARARRQHAACRESLLTITHSEALAIAQVHAARRLTPRSPRASAGRRAGPTPRSPRRRSSRPRRVNHVPLVNALPSTSPATRPAGTPPCATSRCHRAARRLHRTSREETHHDHQDHAERQGQPAGQAGRRRAALHRAARSRG